QCRAFSRSNGRDNREHDWDHLADFWKFGIWPCSVRSDGAIRAASAATLPSYVSAIAVALATGRRHTSGEYSELARGSPTQDPATASTKPVTEEANHRGRLMVSWMLRKMIFDCSSRTTVILVR